MEGGGGGGGAGYSHQYRIVYRPSILFKILTLFKGKKLKIDTLFKEKNNDNSELCEQVLFYFFSVHESLASGIEY